MIRIAAAQINSTVGDLAGNREKIAENIRRAKEQDADIIVFSELTVCGYPPEDLLYKDHFVRDNIKVLRSLIKETAGITAIIGFADRDKKKNLYNAAAVICNKHLKGIYRKEELPNYGVFDEKRYFQQGKNNKIFSIGKEYFGVSICEDLWVDKGVCQWQARAGAQLLINLSASPYDVGKFKEREKLLKKRAKKEKVFVCYVNLVGGQDELVFDGGSLIVDPQGTIVASGKQFCEDLVIADINIGGSRAKGAGVSNIISLGQQCPKEKQPIKKHLSKRLSQDE
ncbi:MAG: hypothetical protein KAR32_10085, partial [Candidatus Omnitrophica bacterium]|nr:hypothetical protein [Candidatus Omnitrophota bacterium]